MYSCSSFDGTTADEASSESEGSSSSRSSTKDITPQRAINSSRAFHSFELLQEVNKFDHDRRSSILEPKQQMFRFQSESSFTCPLCHHDCLVENDFKPHSLKSSSTCTMCKPCARKAFVDAIDKKQFPICCPVCESQTNSGSMPIEERGETRSMEEGGVNITGLEPEVVCFVLSEAEQELFYCLSPQHLHWTANQQHDSKASNALKRSSSTSSCSSSCSSRCSSSNSSALDSQSLDSFTCSICYDECPVNDAFPPHAGHSSSSCKMCRLCARRSFWTAITQNHFPICCPVCSIGTPEEENALQQEVVCSVLQSAEQELFHRLSWQHANPQARHCPAVDCPGFSFPDQNTGRCQCEVCRTEWCGQCSSQHDAQQQCNAVDPQVKEFIEDNRFKRCPSCLHMVEKEEGCNHMTCRCRHEFCYQCGESVDPLDYSVHFTDPTNTCSLFDHDSDEESDDSDEESDDSDEESDDSDDESDVSDEECDVPKEESIDSDEEFSFIRGKVDLHHMRLHRFGRLQDDEEGFVHIMHLMTAFPLQKLTSVLQAWLDVRPVFDLDFKQDMQRTFSPYPAYLQRLLKHIEKLERQEQDRWSRLRSREFTRLSDQWARPGLWLRNRPSLWLRNRPSLWLRNRPSLWLHSQRPGRLLSNLRLRGLLHLSSWPPDRSSILLDSPSNRRARREAKRQKEQRHQKDQHAECKQQLQLQLKQHQKEIRKQLRQRQHQQKPQPRRAR
jgi:hypothetical protein